MSKLLLIGSGSVHTYNYYKLIEGYFAEILMLTDNIREEFKSIKPIKADFSIRNPIRGYQNYLSLKKKIQEYRPDIIHVHQANSTSYLTIRAARETGIPVVVTAWGSDVLIAPEQSRLINKMCLYNLRNANYLTADSKNVADKIIERVGKTKNEILVANFGVDDFYEKVPKENIIYSNRLHNKLYRINEVIRAFARFTENNNENWKLVMAGEGTETEKLKALAADLKISNAVDFVGWLNKDENYNYYNKAKIFISIPESDATAISLLEAMSAGCLPMVSDLPANREWITDGLNGIIVKDLDENFLQKAMMIDIQKAMAINQELIRKYGTKEVNRKNFIELYQNIITIK